VYTVTNKCESTQQIKETHEKCISIKLLFVTKSVKMAEGLSWKISWLTVTAT